MIDLTAVERGDRLNVQFTVPSLTTEGLVVKSIGAVELRIGPNIEPAFNIQKWAESAVRIDVPPPAKMGPVQARVPVEQFVGKEVTVAVRLANAKGRVSEWSNPVTVHVEQGLATPANLAAENTAEGVRLKWNALNTASFRVFRSSGKDPQPLLLSTIDGPSYLDKTSSYGVKYEYFVQGVQGQNESEIAGPEVITPKDRFAPAVPSSVTATTGLDAIELAWERNSEQDFRGYRVYRALGDGGLARIADLIEAPNYSDRKIESGKRYRYAVTSVDQVGNESEKSTIVEAVAP